MYQVQEDSHPHPNIVFSRLGSSINPSTVSSSTSPSSAKSPKVYVLSFYHHLLSSPLLSSLVLLLSLLLASLGTFGSLSILQKFDPTLLLDSESYLRQFLDTKETLYPTSGWAAELYSGPWGHDHLPAWDGVVERLERLRDTNTSLQEVDCWWQGLKEYLEQEGGSWQALTPASLSSTLSNFLFSPVGTRFKSDFKFSGPLTCGAPAPEVLATRCHFTYRVFAGPEEHVPAR